MLFLTEDNSFRGEDTSISLDEVVEATKVLSLKICYPAICINLWRLCHGRILSCRSCTATCSQANQHHPSLRMMSACLLSTASPLQTAAGYEWSATIEWSEELKGADYNMTGVLSSALGLHFARTFLHCPISAPAQLQAQIRCLGARSSCA